MTIGWKLTISQKRDYTDSIVLRHDMLGRLIGIIYELENHFDTDNISYTIESEVMDDGED